MKLAPYLLALSLLTACQTQNNYTMIDVQGHRGCRGLLPENTIPAFLHAIDLGVTTLELDVVVNAAGDVIVSHEPFFNHEIATTPDGSLLTPSNQSEHNMYPLSIAEIQAYDVGSKAHPRFPQQRKMAVHKPMLAQMVSAVEEKVKAEHLKLPLYNIEIKRNPDHDNIFHPGYQEFADIVIRTVEDLGIMDRSFIQCFDIETLQYLHRVYPSVRLVYLVENIKPFQLNFEELGFKPAAYSPYFKLVSDSLITYCRQEVIDLVPWTVNESKDMKTLLDQGVTHIITDYPDRLLALIHQSAEH